jgi:outer membrane immunogenic protein
MLCQSSGARIEPPRQAGRRVGPFTSLAAVDLLALADAAAFAPAQAADLNGKISTIQNEEEFGFRKPDVFNWSGVYVGGHLAAAWGEVGWSGVERLKVSHEVDGLLAGGHLGFNHQFGRWVGSSLSDGDVASSDDGTRFRDVARIEIDKLFFATLRLEYDWDRSLAYVKGGYASAEISLQGGDGDVAFSSSERQAGFTIGGGIEYAFTNRVIFGLEYKTLVNSTHVLFATDGNDVVGAVPVKVEPDVLHVAMARLSLKFGDEGVGHRS